MRLPTPDAKIAAASQRDYGDVIALLEAASLPTEDLESSSMAHFVVARDASARLIGAIGFERYERAALLRSLVVAAESRNRNLGKQMVAELEAHCRSLAVTELFLLTTTAWDFFSSSKAMRQSVVSLSRWRCVPPRNLPGSVQTPQSV